MDRLQQHFESVFAAAASPPRPDPSRKETSDASRLCRAGLAGLLGLSAAAARAGTPQADLRVAITDGQTRACPARP
jgi:hypothetical protein